VDEASGYEYIIAELDSGNPSLLHMAEIYLGSKSKWSVIVKFNNIQDPTDIPDGESLKIPIRKAPRNARLSVIENKVMAKRTVDLDWTGAELNMRLSVGDGVRTMDNSGATVSFNDGSDLRISENSMVFIADLSPPDTNKPKTSRINLEEGTLSIRKRGALSGEIIEVETTETVVNPELKPGGEVSFRTKTTDDDNTLVMSYKGELEVSAEGETVDLKPGEGSEIAKGSAPSKPELLLAAPAIESKFQNISYTYGNPTLEWDSVDGALTYLLEIAYNRDFTKIYKVFTAIPEPEISKEFRKGRYYWRVCAVDAKGFEGYWSKTETFDVLVEGSDKKMPVSSIEYINGEPTEIGGMLYITPYINIKIISNDDVSGVRSTFVSIDGKAEKLYTGKPMSFTAGRHEIDFYAIDKSGKKEEVNNIVFTVDNTQPEIELVKRP